jgi:hypothetical protein
MLAVKLIRVWTTFASSWDRLVGWGCRSAAAPRRARSGRTGTSGADPARPVPPREGAGGTGGAPRLLGRKEGPVERSGRVL